MRRGPVDLRLLRLAGRHRRPLAWLMALAVVHALTVVAGAVLAARVVVTVLDGGSRRSALAILAGVIDDGSDVTRLLSGVTYSVLMVYTTELHTYFLPR